MITYHNAIVILNNDVKVKYRKISSLNRFIEFAHKELPFRVVMFYELPHHDSKTGEYVSSYSLKNGWKYR